MKKTIKVKMSQEQIDEIMGLAVRLNLYSPTERELLRIHLEKEFEVMLK